MGRRRAGSVAGWILALGVGAAAGCGSSASDSSGGAGFDAGAGPSPALDSSASSDGQGDAESNPSTAVTDAAAHGGEGGKGAGTQGPTQATDAATDSDSATGTGSAHDGGTAGGADSAADGSDGGATQANLYSIPLTTTSDAFVYEAELTIGDQTFAMDIDTGSTTIGVAAATCRSCGGITPQYSPTTGVSQGETASTMYEDGSGWSGTIYRDTVSLEHGTPSVTLDFVSITSQTQFFEENAYQGILGLGAQANAEPNTDSYTAFVQAKGVPPVMSFELCNTAGTMWLGGYDAASASAAPTYTPMLAINDSNAFYTINVDNLLLGGTSLGFDTGADFQEPIVDTGTSLFYLPNQIFSAMLSAINASSGLQALFPAQRLTNEGCVQAAGVTDAMVDAELPSMSINLPSTTSGAPDVTITSSPSRSYLYDNGDGQFCLAIAQGGTSDASTLGITFLRGFVTVIDIGNSRVGFAADTGCATNGGLRAVHPRAWPPTARPPRLHR